MGREWVPAFAGTRGGLDEVAEGAAGFPVFVALDYCLALVVPTLALAKAELNFGPVVLYIKLERYESQTLLGDTAPNIVNLASTHQELAGPSRVVVAATGRVVEGNVHAVKPQLVIFQAGVSASKVNSCGAYGLDFGAGQLYAGFEPLKHFVVKEGLTVDGYISSTFHHLPADGRCFLEEFDGAVQLKVLHPLLVGLHDDVRLYAFTFDEGAVGSEPAGYAVVDA